MSEGLDRFLSKGKPGQAAVAEQPPVAAEEPKGDPVVTEAPPAPEPPAPPVDDEDGAPPAPTGEDGFKAAYFALRTKRQDYKGERDRLDGELKALRQQLEDAKRAPPTAPPSAAPQPAAAPPPPPAQRPNAVEDPEGAAAFDRLQLKLDMSEEMLRERHGDEAVDEALAAYKKLVAVNPAIHAQCLAQRNPYKWMFSEVKRAQAAEKIGGDPDAYVAKLRADIRAEIEAEMAQKAQPATTPVAQPVSLPRSLANATSAAPRSAPAWTGPTPLGQILKR